MNEGKHMFEFIKELYPICRSITGNGVRETLSLIKERIHIDIHEVSSGTKVLDWTVPREWNIKRAWIKDPKGNIIVDFKELNLHVLNYSSPVHEKVSLSDLKEHLFTLPDQPDKIPYRTSYHNENWGFCISHDLYLSLKDGEYEVFIDSSLTEGSLTYGEYFIKGTTDEEVLFSTHICHPSLANDNLSGIAVATELAKKLNERNNRYSYRFLFIPGTIGSITWLSQNRDKIQNIKYGLVLTLLGDTSKFNYKKSRIGDAAIDEIVENCLKNNKDDYGIIDFYPYGYDERQFCSPGFNLPIGRLSRSLHGQFDEYHTSADNLEFVHQDKLQGSLEFLNEVVETIESNHYFLNLSPYGEPQLGKRGLFKKIGGHSKAKDYQMALLWMLNQSDGKNSVLDISTKSGLPFMLLKKAADDLEIAGLLKKVNKPA